MEVVLLVAYFVVLVLSGFVTRQQGQMPLENLRLLIEAVGVSVEPVVFSGLEVGIEIFVRVLVIL